MHESETLPEMFEAFNQEPYKSLLRDYEYEEIYHKFLHRNFGPLFTREVQLQEVPHEVTE